MKKFPHSNFQPLLTGVINIEKAKTLLEVVRRNGGGSGDV